MDDDFNDLQSLLRLKRFEAPPAEYFEDFLHDFHRRQRAELLQRPLWRLALDRLEGALPTFNPTNYAYAGSFAVATAVAMLAGGHILTSHSPRAGSDVARVEILPKTHASSVPSLAVNYPHLDLHSSRANVRLPELNFDQQPSQPYTASTRSSRPRYVLDAQPVSYVQTTSF